MQPSQLILQAAAVSLFHSFSHWNIPGTFQPNFLLNICFKGEKKKEIPPIMIPDKLAVATT